MDNVRCMKCDVTLKSNSEYFAHPCMNPQVGKKLTDAENWIAQGCPDLPFVNHHAEGDGHIIRFNDGSRTINESGNWVVHTSVPATNPQTERAKTVGVGQIWMWFRSDKPSTTLVVLAVTGTVDVRVRDMHTNGEFYLPFGMFENRTKYSIEGEPMDRDVPKQAVKADNDKPTPELLPFAALVEVSAVLAYGKTKYQAHNWRKGLLWSRLLGAALRHLFAWAASENKDSETGRSHLAHAACCILFLLEYEQTGGYGHLDDRAKKVDR